jgi:uncharacterized protein (UPF0276 family)
MRLFPALGHGVGLRPKHYSRFLNENPDVAWVEAITENFLSPGGRPLDVLQKARRDRPVVLHGVSLCIGSVDPLDKEYLTKVRDLARRIEPAFVSDHLCWGRYRGRYTHDLLPLPYTEESLTHVTDRVKEVQDFLGRRFVLENPSTYVAFRESTMTEWEFLARVAEDADCGILLDVNNVFVSARNHGFDAAAYLAAMPGHRIAQIHLAGHADKGTYLFDTHDAPVPDSVWSLYASTIRRFGAISTLIEWDDHVPELDELLAQSRRAAEVEQAAVADTGAAA